MTKVIFMTNELFQSRDFFLPDLGVVAMAASVGPADYPAEGEKLFHRDFWKLVYIRGGHGLYELNGHKTPITSGTVICTHPDDLTSYRLSERLELYQILFARQFLLPGLANEIFHRSFFNFLCEDPDRVDQGEPLLQRVIPACYGLESSFKKIYWEYENQDICTPLKMQLLLLNLLLEIFRKHEQNRHRATRGSAAATIMDFLRKNDLKKIDRKKLAHALGISVSYLSTYIRCITGQSLSEIQQQLRLHMAAELLRNNNKMKIIEIASRCGFQDLPLFYRQFRRYYRESPGAFRNQENTLVPLTEQLFFKRSGP